ncbi:MAG: 16S rRNA (guanine(527)-N(7))-methyltransferase RsmG [Candidatus Wallbacteria bacterium]|nr:16S rRNA (guanine(527)-N(7))-methyltransferase RsmG [Candidatus Wallbacteria bacterium]
MPAEPSPEPLPSPAGPAPATVEEFQRLLHELLVPFAAGKGVALPPESLSRLAAYSALLLERNQVVNLTGCRSPRELVARHLADAVQFATRLPSRPPATLVDLGSGGGLPGLPLALLLPRSRILLVESVRKKARFLEEARELLALPNVQVLCARAEDLGRDRAHRDRHGAVTSRACASLAVSLEYGLPLLKQGGLFLSPKGPSAPDELATAARAIQALAGRLLDTTTYRLPEAPSDFTMIAIEKTGPTPAAYPRRAAQIARKSL